MGTYEAINLFYYSKILLTFENNAEMTGTYQKGTSSRHPLHRQLLTLLRTGSTWYSHFICPLPMEI